MVKLRIKLVLFSLLSKAALALLFLILMPWMIERINLIQVDNDLIDKREKVISLISSVGIEPFIATPDSSDVFGSYNILKEEFISLEATDDTGDDNFLEVTPRIIEGEEIEYRVLNYSFLVDGRKYLLQVGKSMESIRNARKSSSTVMLIFMVSVILVTFLTDLQYTGMLLKPLRVITGKLKGISSPATFDHTPVKTTTTEFLNLDRSMSEMMTSITELFRKEKEITVNISHELLTPVSVLRSKLENLLLEEDLDEDVADRIAGSLKTLQRLQNLVNSLLMIARIESRQYLREDSFMINELLDEIYSELQPLAEDAGVVFENSDGPDHLVTASNRPLISSMLYNIIYNAIRNTARYGSVIIGRSAGGPGYSVNISDTGAGMSAEQVSNLFSRFRTRLDVNSNNTGIGLAIAKSIADFHGITISVSSEPGKGTSFLLTFPLS